jgi:alpha-aminoadipic semialdehyde synthase
MPALDAILKKNIRLIDYERIADQKNNRLIAFGKYAGIAGAIDFMKGFG